MLSKNSFNLLPEPLKLGKFLTNYCIIYTIILQYYKMISSFKKK